MKNERGFGLIEVMFTLGIMSVVMLGLMQVTQHAMLVSQTADQKNNLTSIVGSTTGTALNAVTCTMAVTKVAQKLNEPFHFGTLQDGANLAEYHLTVKSISLQNPTLIAAAYEGTKVYLGTITLVATSDRPILGGQTFAPRTIAAVYVTTNPAGTIIACGAVMPPLPTQPTPEKSAMKTFDFDADPKVCENFPVKARCSGSQKIVVSDASYGANCAGVPANYGQDMVKALCNGQASCDFTAGNVNNCTNEGVFVDPAVNCPKSFHMSYYCS